MLFNVQVSPYLWLLLLAFLIAVSLVYYSLRNYQVSGAILFGVMIASICWWIAFYTMEVIAVDLVAKDFWLKVKHVGVAHLPVLWLAFTMQYSGRGRWLRPEVFVPVELIALLNMGGAWTNSLHELFWAEIWVADGILEVTRGSWSWFALAYNYVLFLVGFWLMFVMWQRAEHFYRRQIGVVLLGSTVPMVANFITLGGMSPIPAIDLTPFAFTVTGMAGTWGLFRFQLLDIMPVAYEAIVHNMSDGVIVLDARNRVVSFNPAIQTIMALDEADAIGHQAAEVLQGWPELLAQLQTDRQYSTETIHCGEDDCWNFEAYVSPLADRRGRASGRLVVLHDITGRVRAAEERERLIVELDAFAHTVAHDLKNPLSVTMGYAELVADKLDVLPPDMLTRNLRLISYNSRKMHSIINELLLLASVRKIDEIQRSPVDMAAVVVGAQERLQRMIEEHDPEIVIPGEWPDALGYHPWVEEVVTNYLSNAIKYGGEPPRVELGATVQDDGFVCYWVRDNGPGIEPAQQAILFEQFTRLDETRAEGHGLGLSIVKRIVEKLGGEVGMESVVGVGSTFQFTLPSVVLAATTVEAEREQAPRQLVQ